MKNSIILMVVFFIIAIKLQADMLLPSEVYKLAIKNSNKLKSIQLNNDAKKEDINQIKAQYYPQVDLMVDWNKANFERNDLIFSRNPRFSESSLDYTFSLKQKILDFETDTKLKVENKRSELYDIEMQRTTQDLSGEVFEAYLLALVSKTKIDFLNSLVDYNLQKYTSIEKKFKMKLANKMDLLQSKVDLEKSKIELNKEKKLYSLYTIKLKRYTLREDIEIPAINLDNFNLNDIFNKKEFQKLNTIEDSLEILQYRTMIEVNSLEIENARQSYYPKMDFDARYVNYVSSDTSSDYEQTSRFSLKLMIPLYKGGARSSKIASLQLRKKATMEEFTDIKKELKLKNDELKTTILTTADSIKLFKEALVSTNSYLDFVTLGYENGLKSIVDFYEAKNKLFETKYTYINTIHEFINAYIEFLIINNKVEYVDRLDKIL